MSAYADASFLGSLYTTDTLTASALDFIRRNPTPVLFSPFAEFELYNAVQLHVFRSRTTRSEAERIWQHVEADRQRGFLQACDVPEGCFEKARQLSQKRTKDLGTRAGDILHVAIALELKTEWFLTFDKRQQQLAKLEGLRVIS